EERGGEAGLHAGGDVLLLHESGKPLQEVRPEAEPVDVDGEEDDQQREGVQRAQQGEARPAGGADRVEQQDRAAEHGHPLNESAPSRDRTAPAAATRTGATATRKT